ncbi:hypothetical protein SAMN05880574_12146 [Chryseobacterium sp. RU37D]|uniref:hypothetical protein n=1 Tax=Chryseobacterium sp. RU37D TaxID=1907397 RepID=UPI0009551F9B|nr:hypothetical protein [Chryseobacterium sp. RU37D]SIQ69850.1 hypothetical protein SAMN05880574_12146 [Chryseobacterium sp. RU37D]
MNVDNISPNNKDDPNHDQVNEFFDDFNVAEEEQEELSITEESGEIVLEELAESASSLQDFKNFQKHEEFRLKVLEFKLRKKTQLKESHSKFKDKKNERRLRKENAKKAFWFSSIWAVFIAFFILLHGFKEIKVPMFLSIIEIKFSITETEFMFVCGTLTASILIFYLTVIKNLFPNKLEEKSSSKNTENQSSPN